MQNQCRCLIKHVITPPEIRNAFRVLTNLLHNDRKNDRDIEFLRHQLYGKCEHRTHWYDPDSEALYSNHDGSLRQEDHVESIMAPDGEFGDECIHCGEGWGDHRAGDSYCLEADGSAARDTIYETTDIVPWVDGCRGNLRESIARTSGEAVERSTGKPISKLDNVKEHVFMRGPRIYCEGDE